MKAFYMSYILHKDLPNMSLLEKMFTYGDNTVELKAKKQQNSISQFQHS